MKTATLSGDTETIEHALQRLVWTEQKKFAAMLAVHDLTFPAVPRARLGPPPFGRLPDRRPGG